MGESASGAPLPPADRLLALVELQNEIVASGLDLEEVLQLAVDRAAQLTGASAGVVEMPDGDEMVYRAASGAAAAHLGLRLPAETSLSGMCLRVGAALRCDDAETDERVDAERCRVVGARSLLCAPLRHRGIVVGVLKVYAPAPQAFDGADVAFLEHLSGVIAAHMSHAARFTRVDDEGRRSRRQAIAGLRSLARAIDAKDPRTRQHSDRVASLARAIADAIGWRATRARLLQEAALVHDVGKIGTPDSILFKPGRLTTQEYEQVKAHALLGANIVEGVLSAEQVEWVRWHHERPDGLGYPDGLVDSAIPDGAAILALADTWDVMTVSRPYSTPKAPSLALRECRDLAGRQFRGSIVEVLAAIV